MAGQLSSPAAAPLISLVSNLGNAESEQVFFMQDYPVSQSFQVGASGATISSVNIAFGNVVNPTGVQVSLFSDSSAAPGSSLGIFSLSGPPASIPFNSPTFTGSFTVTANTKYWIQIAALGGNPADMNWISYTTNFSETGEAGWSIGDTYLFDGGFPGSGSIRMTITGTPSSVPEPSSFSLLALGLGAWSLHRRRS